ncbi:MAG: hypothetical protein ACODAJ_11375, partial [Planctomycetota bacterium]
MNTRLRPGERTGLAICLLTFLGGFVQAADAPFGDEGLVAWWPGEGTGDAVRDAAGGHDGTVHGAAMRVRGPFGGQALAFFGG